ncbi:MAG: hypothetical protein HYR72_14425 [Deltaproteobacteria bacterium]|nr:hypothetical protein [Deltaproteobacteria bacterium]MBI3391539.1 hypothetical protein [Deltaproteobacteria bacterium]
MKDHTVTTHPSARRRWLRTTAGALLLLAVLTLTQTSAQAVINPTPTPGPHRDAKCDGDAQPER